MQSSFRRNHGWAMRAVPALLTLLIALLSATPVHVFGAGDVTPAFTLISVFYWCVYSPGALPYTFLFVLGLLQDALGGMPLGVSSFLFVLFAYIIDSQRRLMGRAVFGTVWGTCVLLTGIAAIAQWGIMCMVAGKIFDYYVPFTRWLATCASYPLLHLLLTHIYKRIRMN